MPSCHGEAEQMAKVRQFISEGKSEDDILLAFIDYGGEQMLIAPPNRGFNRVGWLFPYLVAGAGLLGIAFAARRWTRPSVAAAGGATLDPAMDARLDDELRNLD